jgi:hypothetical protein
LNAVDPFQPLNLKCDILVSKFAFTWVNLCYYSAGIAAAIDANLTPWPELSGVSEACVADFTHPLVTDPTEPVSNAYFATVKAELCNFGADGECAGSKPVTYTPLHGVGVGLSVTHVECS